MLIERGETGGRWEGLYHEGRTLADEATTPAMGVGVSAGGLGCTGGDAGCRWGRQYARGRNRDLQLWVWESAHVGINYLAGWEVGIDYTRGRGRQGGTLQPPPDAIPPCARPTPAPFPRLTTPPLRIQS
jgi:hypothetical protein